MAQELELIVEMLREIKRANSTNSESFDRLLASIGNKLEVIDKNSASADLIKAYLGEIAKSVDDKYTTTLNKFSDIEKALKAMFQEQEEHVKNKDIKELFDIFSTNMNNFYSEARQQKALLAGIENRLADISNDKSDKEDVLRTITLLRNDFENLNHGYKSTIDSVNSDLKTILTNLIKSDQTAINTQMKEQLDVMYKTATDIVNYLTLIDKRDSNLEILLSNVATNESLKMTQGVIDSIIQKSEEISEKINNLADKSDIEGLQVAANIMNKKMDETATKELFAQISDKTESLVSQTDEIKQNLANVTKDIEKLPDTSVLEDSLQSLFNKLDSLEKDIEKTDTTENISDIDSKLGVLTEELTIIKNIVSDISDVVTSKVLSAINDISFEEESYDIKNHVSKMLSILPQKEDIDKLLENDKLNKTAVDELIQKADKLADRLDNLPTHDDMATLNSNQLSLVENLQGVANKDDIEALSAKSDDIENMIDKLNFDDEFEHLYDKSASIEKWLSDSKIKENTEKLVEGNEHNAKQENLMEVLQTVHNIASEIDELSQNMDAKKVGRTVADVYQMIEDLKNDFLSTSEMHNDSIIVSLSELQKTVSAITSGEEFAKFTEDLRTFVEDLSKNTETIDKNIEQILVNQEESNNSIESKLVSISDYLAGMKTLDTEDLKSAVGELKEIIENKKSNFTEIEAVNKETTAEIKEYLLSIKEILDTNDKNTNSDILAKIDELTESLQSVEKVNADTLSDVLEKLGYFESILTEQNQNSAIKDSLSEISDIKSQILSLSDSFKALNFEKNTSEESLSVFVADKLSELGENLSELSLNIDEKLQTGFAYNAELIEEKASCLLDLIKELRHTSTENIDLYERLTVTDNKLMDVKQELELINTDVISSLNAKTDTLLQELEPIKTMIATIIRTNTKAEEIKIKENLTAIHDAVQEDLSENTKYSPSSYEKLEESYTAISRALATTENNLRDFILGDIDSVLIKIDNLRNDLEDKLNRIAPPEAENMKEFKEFVDKINEFKSEQKDLVVETAKDVKDTLSQQMEIQHNEIKSMLTVALNNEEIINAIEDLKKCFQSRAKDLSKLQNEESIEDIEFFESNQYEKEFETDKNAQIIEELKQDFDKFSELIKDLSGENAEIKEVLNVIKNKMDTISVAKPQPLAEISPTDTDIDIDEDIDIVDEDIDTESESEEIQDTESENEVETTKIENNEDQEQEEIIVGEGNFDFVKALNLLKQDIQNLHSDVEKVIPKEDQKKVSSTLKSIPTLGNDNLLLTLNNKIELLAQTIKPQEWLDEIKTYIAGDEIHTMLEEINGKIDILTLSDNSEWIGEIKQALEQLNSSDSVSSADPQTQSMLALINEKLDILASTDDYDLIEEVRDALEQIDNSEQTEKTHNLLNVISDKIDILAATDNSEELDEIRETLVSIEEKFDEAYSSNNTEEMSELKTALETIENVVNELSSISKDTSEIEELRSSLSSIESKVDIIAQSDEIDEFEDLKEILDSIESKIDNVASLETNNNIEDIKYTLLNVDEKLDSANKSANESIKSLKDTLSSVDKKVDNVQRLSESDAKITSILETLNHKIDIIAESDNASHQRDFQDVKDLIMAQTDYIDSLEKNNKTDAVKKCLKELTIEVNNINSNNNTKQIQKTLREMKESIMAAVVTIFEQVSFIEESEDIKDFVEEKTDEINQNLAAVTEQLKQITSPEDGPDYTYSMQDIESDLAKLRLALNELQTNEQEHNATQLASILNNINQIGTSVEDLQNSLTKEEVFGLRIKFDRINTDIKSLQALTNQLVVKSGESYNALNSTFEDFGKVITDQLTTKVDKVTKMLETSNASDKVMRQALIYMGEWIDSASESMNKISTNSDEIVDVKSALEGLKKTVPAQTEILNSIEEKFDEQQERLAYFEKQISKLGGLEDKFEEQQERIDRLEIALDKILSAVEDIDDSKVTRKIDKIDKQIAKLSTNIEKLASYVD
ncbi:MAG: hypothetical protein DK841_08465 [Candidatus Melainabacteria bacterium]|nr:MAG: hypothetical protein DK841_08465 [Candidatus Melainabacteria bacterium]